MKKPLDVENLHAIDVINPLVKEFLETELMQEKLDNLELSYAIEREVVGWYEAMHTLELTDEELAEDIVEFYKSLSSSKSEGSAYVASVENSQGFEGVTTKATEENFLHEETSTPKKELKTLPLGIKYAYLDGNETFPVIMNNNFT